MPTELALLRNEVAELKALVTTIAMALETAVAPAPETRLTELPLPAPATTVSDLAAAVASGDMATYRAEMKRRREAHNKKKKGIYRIKERICDICNTPNQPNAKICRNCRSPLD